MNQQFGGARSTIGILAKMPDLSRFLGIVIPVFVEVGWSATDRATAEILLICNAKRVSK